MFILPYYDFSTLQIMDFKPGEFPSESMLFFLIETVLHLNSSSSLIF